MSVPENFSNQHETCIQWARSILAARHNDSAFVEEIAETPYSYVAKLTVDDAVYYLKKTPASLFVEAKTLELIKGYYSEAAIPSLVSSHKDENCFLVESCGDLTLRRHFAGHLNLDLLVQGIHEYRQIQEKTSLHLKTFLDMGVPDWRLPRLPEFYNDLVQDEIRLKEWGFSSEECQDLKDQKEVFSLLCEKINALTVPDTLNHSDFQENNMVFDFVHKKVSVIDWGEITIGHPLLSLIGCLHKACRRYNVDPNSTDYKTLRDACLIGWGIDEKRVSDIYGALSAVGDIYYALTLSELIKNTGHNSAEWGARIKMGCLSFVNRKHLIL